MRRHYHEPMGNPDLRARLVGVMAALRNEGYLARANFACCQNCAGYELTNLAAHDVRRGRTVNGCVFWHHQDEDDYRDRGYIYLAYGEMDSTEYGTIGQPTVEVGRHVAQLLEAEGLDYDWNGNPDERIMVYVGALRKAEEAEA